MKRRGLLDSLSAYIASAPAIPQVRETIREVPFAQSTVTARPQLDKAFDKHLDDIKPGASVGFNVYESVPKGTVSERIQAVIDTPDAYAGSSAPSKQPPSISINPNADRALYAHELGHLASQQTDVGHLVASLRENPKLKKALMASLLVIPGAAAALEAGDDDYDTALALAALSSAPTLIDEGLATKHGLALMDKSGMRASLGQRGKLAGGLMSYLAAPVLAATAGNYVGNLMD